jgi:ADP-heptose:LPS heptosyltransferase
MIGAMNIPAKPWTKTRMPQRILVIRLQAMGDVVITLPYLQSLRNALPADVKIDLLTRKEVEGIPRSIELFDEIYSIGGERNFRKQFLLSLPLIPKIIWRRYDVVIDLQNNRISRLVRKFAMPGAWSEFDKTSPLPAGERTRLTIEAVKLVNINACTKFKIRSENTGELLKKHGWDQTHSLVVLNPAGAFESRNWPIENYGQFAQLWLTRFPQTQFLMLGVELIEKKAAYLKDILNEKLINLVNKTSAEQAFAIVQKASFVLSEDSGSCILHGSQEFRRLHCLDHQEATGPDRLDDILCLWILRICHAVIVFWKYASMKTLIVSRVIHRNWFSKKPFSS